MNNSLYQSLLNRLRNKHVKLATRFHKNVKEGTFQKQRYRHRKEAIDRLKSIEKKIASLGHKADLKPNLNYKHWALALAMGVVVSANAQQRSQEDFLKQQANQIINDVQPLAQSIFFEPKEILNRGIPRNILTGDLDGDGDVDGIYVSALGVPIILRNQGSLNFTTEDLTSEEVQIVSKTLLGDFDGDGDLDLFMQNGPYNSYSAQIWVNDGAGNFASQPVTFPSVDLNDEKLLAADIDGDGDLDLIGETEQETPFYRFVTLFTNSGFAFNDSTALKGSYPFSQSSSLLSVFDVDGDTDLDIVYTSLVPSFSSNAVQVFENNGSGAFTSANSYLAPTNNPYNGTKPFDFDNDGDLDMVGLMGSGVRARVFTSNGTILWLLAKTPLSFLLVMVKACLTNKPSLQDARFRQI